MASNAPAFSAPADWQKIGVDPDQGTGGYYKPIYSTDPNSIGYWTGQEHGPDENGMGGYVQPIWHGSSQDFTGLTGGGAPDPGFYGHNTASTFTDKNGLKYTYDYATDSFQGLDPQTAAGYLKNNPDAYYGTLANQLKDDYFNTWRLGHRDDSILNQLESLKSVSPQAYYNAKIGLLGSQAGWYQGQNTTSGIPEIQKQIQALAPEAMKAGLSLDQLNSAVSKSFTDSARWNQQLIANEAASGGAFFKPSDAAFIGSIALAGITAGASTALTTALTGAIGSTAAAVAAPALLGSAAAAGMAALTGGDVGKAALTGAIGGAVGGGVNTLGLDAAANLVGGGDAIMGVAKISEIANSIGMTTSQVSGLVSSAISTELSGLATGANPDKLLERITNNLAATALGNYAGNLTASISSKDLMGAANAVAAVTKIGVNSALNGQDLQTSLINNIGQIIGAASQTTKYTDITKLFNSDGSLSTSGLDEINKDTESVDVAKTTEPAKVDVTQTTEPAKVDTTQTSDVLENKDAYLAAVATGDPNVVRAVVDNNTAVIDALNNNDVTGAVTAATTAAENLASYNHLEGPPTNQAEVPMSGKDIAETVIGAVTGSGDIQAAEKTSPQPDNPNVVQAVYQPNDQGGWNIVVPDGQGGFTTLGIASQGGAQPTSGEGTGDWYDISQKDGAGFPTPVTAQTPEQRTEQEDPSQKVLEEFNKPDGTTVKHMADDRWVVSDTKTGELLGEINAPTNQANQDIVTNAVDTGSTNATKAVDTTKVALPVTSVTNPDGSVTTYYGDNTSKTTIPPTTNTTGAADTTTATDTTKVGALDTVGGGDTTTATDTTKVGALDTVGGGGGGTTTATDTTKVGALDTVGGGDTTTATDTTKVGALDTVGGGGGGGGGGGTSDTGGGTSDTGGGGTSDTGGGGTGGGDNVTTADQTTEKTNTEDVTKDTTSGGGGGGGGGGGSPVTPIPTVKPVVSSAPSSGGLSNLAANPAALSAFLTPIFGGGGTKIKQKNPLEAFSNQIKQEEQAPAPVAQVPLDPYTADGFASPIYRATGGAVFKNTMPNQEFATLDTGLTQAAYVPIKQKNPLAIFGKAEGGSINEHNPQFYSEGGLSIQHRYVKGPGDGTSDSVPAMLANGEFVIPADVVSSLGNGSNDSGAKILDEFLKTIRDHKHKSNAKKLPPDSKGPLSYLQQAKKKVKV